MPGNNALYSAGVTSDSTGPSGFPVGIVLNGSDYATIPSGTPFGFAAGSSFTVRAWAKTTSNSAFQGLITQIYSSTTNWTIGMVSGKPYIYVNGFNGNSNMSYGGSTNFNDGAWHLYELSVSSTTATLYVDGVALAGASGSGSYTPTTTGILFQVIGGYEPPSTGIWTGSVGEVSVYSSQLHTSNYTPPTTSTSTTAANLVGLWRLSPAASASTAALDCSGITFAVSPTTGNSGTLTFAGTLSQWSTFPPAFAMTGSGDTLGTTTVTSNTAASAALTSATTTGAQTITDAGSLATASFTVGSAFTPPSPPTLSINGAGTLLTFGAPSAGTYTVTGVNLYQGSTTGGESGTASQTGGSPSGGTFTVTPAAPGSSTYYTVKAIDSQGNLSAASAEVHYSTPALTLPTAPTPVLTQSGPNLVVTYSAPTAGTYPVASTSLYEGTSSGGESGTPTATNAGTGGGTFTVSKPTSGSYYFTLKTVDVNGNVSTASTEVYYTLPPSGGSLPFYFTADYGTPYSGMASSLGITIYDNGGNVLLSHTLGQLAECGTGTGKYNVTAPLQSGWAGSVVVDAPAGAVAISQSFGNLASEISQIVAAIETALASGITTLASAGLDSVPGYGSFNFRRTGQALYAVLAGDRSGLPTPGQAGSVTLANGYGSISFDTNGNITVSAVTPPA